MSTRSTCKLWGIPLIMSFPFTKDNYGIHVYRDYGQIYVEFGPSYSDWTFELPRFWRRREF